MIQVSTHQTHIWVIDRGLFQVPSNSTQTQSKEANILNAYELRDFKGVMTYTHIHQK